jgi:hypothetical protein
MPVKLRAAKERRPSFSPAALELFTALERVPAHRRHSRRFKDQEHELARRLHLVDEWWTCNSVTDKSFGPCHPEGCIARQDWFRCRAIRLALLQTVKESSGC